ncbi:MAG: hypothetical protein ACXAEU_23755 [Candidatus Hodarchaeales archaeon]
MRMKSEINELSNSENQATYEETEKIGVDLTQFKENWFSNDNTETIKLSSKEKKVLLGLSYLTGKLNDSEIADLIGIKRSTFTVTKKRLETRKLFWRSYTPNFHSLGANILTKSFVQSNGGQIQHEKTCEELYTFKKLPNIIDDQSESNQCLITFVSRNLADFLKAHVHLEDSLPPSLKWDNHHFPFESSTFHRYQDYSALLSKFCKMSLFNENTNQSPPIFSEIPENISNFPAIALKNLETFIAFPNLSTNEISSLLKISENTIRKYKKMFLEKRIMISTFIPDLSLIGINIQLSGVIKLHKFEEKSSYKTLELIKFTYNPTTLIECYNKIFFTTFFTSYEELRKREDSFSNYMNREKISFLYENKAIFTLTRRKTLIDVPKLFQQNARYLWKGFPL